jgi:hypothetical protein
LDVARLREARSIRWALAEFVDDCPPGIAFLVMQTRPPSLSRKFTIETRDRVGTIIGYVKYGTERLAQRPLSQEHATLTRLPNRADCHGRLSMERCSKIVTA